MCKIESCLQKSFTNNPLLGSKPPHARVEESECNSCWGFDKKGLPPNCPTQFWSLLVDPSGIDYEKILEEIDIEGLIKGISMTTPSETINTNNTNSSAVETYASSLIDSIKHSVSKIEDHIKNLEKQSILLNRFISSN